MCENANSILVIVDAETTFWCRFGNRNFVVKIIFCSDFEAQVLVEILKLKFRQKFGQYFAADV